VIMAIVTPGVVPASVLVTGRAPSWLPVWAGFAASLRFDDLPPTVVDRAQLVMLDCIGAIIAGRMEPEIQRIARTHAGPGNTPHVQAFRDGSSGTMLEIDEGNQYARGHPGMHVVPAVLATARLASITGQQALLALVLGYEIGARIGIASKLRVTMHPHGTWGTVGAAVSVAKLYNATREDVASVINVSSSLGLTTSRRTMLEGATVRNTYAGFSNMLGMMTWDLVQAGFTGEADGVGSVYGGIAADDWRPDEMVHQLGTRWEIARNYFKRHAACRYTHGALDALDAIVRGSAGRLDPAHIVSIHVDTYVWAAQLDHPAPANMLAAKFSMPFAIATFIVNGAATLDAFRDAARQSELTTALAAKVVVNEDPALTAKLPELRPARVRITLTDGRVLTAEALTNKGDTEDPYSSADVIEKFRIVTDPVVGAAQAREIIDRTLSLRTAATLAELVHLTEAR
jgi:2-methylcitrate dehydratase PrpD